MFLNNILQGLAVVGEFFFGNIGEKISPTPKKHFLLPKPQNKLELNIIHFFYQYLYL